MSTGFEHQPVGLRAPRIPFDLRCVILAALGYLVLISADWGLAKIEGGAGRHDIRVS